MIENVNCCDWDCGLVIENVDCYSWGYWLLIENNSCYGLKINWILRLMIVMIGKKIGVGRWLLEKYFVCDYEGKKV